MMTGNIRPKSLVFCIGFHRTGTTTFQTALEELGYNVVGMRPKEWNAYENGDYSAIRETIHDFDGFRDMPWPLIYPWLYENYPDAKFVLTSRDPESWVASCVGNYKHRPYRMFSVIYGVNVFKGNEERCKKVYLDHLTDVRVFFADKPGRLLDIDFTQKASWEPICSFLNEAVPQRPFPHANNRPKNLFSRLYKKSLKVFVPGYYRKLARDK